MQIGKCGKNMVRNVIRVANQNRRKTIKVMQKRGIECGGGGGGPRRAGAPVTESARAHSYYSVSTGMQIGAPLAVPFLTPVSKSVLYTLCIVKTCHIDSLSVLSEVLAPMIVSSVMSCHSIARQMNDTWRTCSTPRRASCMPPRKC